MTIDSATATSDPAREAHPPDITAVHSLDHFCLEVPDIDEAAKFYSAFGLDVRPAGVGLDLYTFGCDHRWTNIRPGRSKRLASLTFGAFEEDMGALGDRLAKHGVDALRQQADGSLSFRDPDGLAMAIVAARKSSPDEKSTPAKSAFSRPAGVAAAEKRSDAPRVWPRRLAHIMLFTTDLARTLSFYVDTLGLRISDTAGDVAFLHGAHGSDHHLIAFCKSTGPGLHHCSWDVGSVQEIGLGAMHMGRLGYDHGGWGLGRHVLGSNYFHYVRDPWNSYAEYSFDIDFIPSGFSWPTADFDPEDAFYLWGPKPPQDFGFNYEAVR